MLHSDLKSYRIQTLAVPAHTEMTNIFAHFADKPWAMLLDSANSQHPNAQFDIMVASPISTLAAYGVKCTTTTNIQVQPTTQTYDANPLDVLRSLLNDVLDTSDNGKIKQNQPSENPKVPFIAGALGYFGYDLGRCFETFVEQAKTPYQSPDMAIGVYTWSIVHDKHQDQFYLCSLNQFDSPEPNDIIQLLANDNTAADFSLTSKWQSNLSKHDYIQRLAKIDDYLKAGDCYQVNLAQRFEADYRGSPWQAYLALRDANQAPFSAYIHLENATIMSISPERFLSVNAQTVKTQPIKGTRPRSLDKIEDQKQIDALKVSQKDRAENLMIVDLLRNDLSKTCEDNTIDVPALFEIESFEAVHHLVSTVTGKLNPGEDAMSLLQGAFPGGSITGAPKIRAMQIIDELEPDKRHIYCGSIGYINHFGDMDTSICIRTLLCENDNIYCWAGGGIVLDSVDQDEYQESFDKVSKILPVLERL
ncbi:aminodeoxychorismate synthase component I [Aliiglaciecola sp.]|nr:aminodeoxychorismate synthase component I [Aliiglaciecola sp.]